MNENNKEILKTAKALLEKYGDDVIVRSGRIIESIPTGSFSLDLAIGVGGLPRGRICDFYGRPSSGKSMVATSIVAQVQKAGGFSVYIDAENAFDEKWAKVLGVDSSPDKMIRISPSYGEQAFDIAETFIKAGVDLIVIDSTAALVPKEYTERSMEDGAVIGVQARLISMGLQKLTPLIARSKTVCLFIDQVRKNIGGNPYMHQEEESPTGGMALNFYSSVRVQVKRKDAIKDGDKLLGHRIAFLVKKNKVAPPLRTGEFDLYYDRGIDNTSELFDVALRLNIITRPDEGQMYFYGDKKWRGQNNVRDAISSDANLKEEILSKIRASFL